MIVYEWTGPKVRALRDALRYTQQDFAEKLGCSVDSVSNYERRPANKPLKDKAAAAMDTVLGRLDAEQRERFEAALRTADVVVSSGSETGPPMPYSVTLVRTDPRNSGVREHLDTEPGGEIVSIPMSGPQGQVAYLIGRRDMLGHVAAAIPAVAAMSMGLGLSVAVPEAEPIDLSRLPGKVSDEALDGFTAITRLLASQRQTIAPHALQGLINIHRETVAAHYRAETSTATKRRLGNLLGETSIVASRFCSATGDRVMALAHCAFARKLADDLDDPALGAMARIFESNLRSDAATLIGPDGDVVVGLGLLSEAAIAERLLPPAARARIAAEQAQAYAVLTLGAECRDALARARRAVDEMDHADPTGLFSDWSAPRLLVYEGTCWLFLSEPKKALAALTEALQSTNQISRNVVLAANVDLASAYAATGELEQGCTLLGDTYAKLAAMGNLRGIERARQARARLQPWNREPAVRRLDERLHELVGESVTVV